MAIITRNLYAEEKYILAKGQNIQNKQMNFERLFCT